MTDPELLGAWRAVANAKLNEFRRQCWRLAHLVQAGGITIAAAVDVLAEADIANALSATFGVDLMHDIMFSAFAAGICGLEKPPGVEVAP
jgi:hypothetical protein